MKRRINFAVVFPILILVFTFFGYWLLVSNNQPQAKDQSSEKVWNIAVITAKRGDYIPNLILYGITESPRYALIEAAIDADVLATPVYEGHLVKKNDLLIQLDDREAQFRLRQRLADVNNLKAQIAAELIRVASDKEALNFEQHLVALNKKEVARHRELVDKQVGSEAALDEAQRKLQQQSLAVTKRKLAIDDHKNRLLQLQARLASAQALADKAELDLKRTRIYAPFSGKVSKLRVSVGNRVQIGEVLIEMYDINRVEIRSQIPSNYLSIIQEAMKNQQTLLAVGILDDKKFELVLARLAGSAAIGRGGVDGLFTINTKGMVIAIGRSLQIYLNLPQINQVYAIPNSALYGQNRIYLVKNNRMEGITVKRYGYIYLPNRQTKVLVQSSELRLGDLIVNTQLPNARTGLRINIVK